jgi:hypothetical protein
MKANGEKKSAKVESKVDELDKVGWILFLKWKRKWGKKQEQKFNTYITKFFFFLTNLFSKVSQP